MADQDQTNHGDITDSSVQFGQSGRDLKQIQGDDRSITYNFIQAFPQPGRSWNDRQSRILAKMQEDVITRLDFTLNDEEVLIPLRMKSFGESSGKASLKLRRKLKIEQQAEQDLDLNEAIVQVFCRPDVRKKLLILGAPGAGKTTTLLTLAKDLLKGAIDNPGTVIPIVFELSTWKTGTIENWLAAQLKDVFNLSIVEGQEWIKDEILLPLMDGLDELSLEQQQKCMAELDQFARQYPHLVVCCRVQEYMDARAGLNAIAGQICLEPLNDEQIQQYLQEIQLESLWDEIGRSADMQKMLQDDEAGNPGILRVPLLLSIAAEAYDGEPFVSRSELYEAYIAKRLMLETREREREFKRDQKEQWAYKSVEIEPKWTETRSSLAWVARQLKSGKQVELLIEKMQPSWLESNRSRQQHRLIFGLIFGLIGGLINGLIFGLIFGLIGGLINGLIFGLIIGLDDIETVESFQISPHLVSLDIEMIRSLRQGLIGGLIIGVIIGLTSGLIFGLIIGVIIGLTSGLIIGLIIGVKQDLRLRAKPNQGIWNSLQSLVWTTILSYPAGVTLVMASPVARRIAEKGDWFDIVGVFWRNAPNYLIPGMCGSLVFGFYLGGGVACIQHLCLRIVLTRTGIIPWNFSRFLNYCTERRLLQRVGGRYRFLHRELLDHFAEMRG